MSRALRSEIAELHELITKADTSRLERRIFRKALKRLVRQLKRDSRKLETLINKPTLLKRLTGWNK